MDEKNIKEKIGELEDRIGHLEGKIETLEGRIKKLEDEPSLEEQASRGFGLM